MITKLLATKAHRWGNEEEIRLISDVPGPNYFETDSVKSIYFGHKMKTNRKKTLMRELSGRNIAFFQMVIDNENYKLKAISIT